MMTPDAGTLAILTGCVLIAAYAVLSEAARRRRERRRHRAEDAANEEFWAYCEAQFTVTGTGG